MSFEECFANSCNGAYAELSTIIGKQKLTATAKEFGFGKTFEFGNSQTKASMFDLSDASASDTAWASVGQYDTLVNPYHMLTVLGAVANEGEAVLPYTVAGIKSPSGFVVEKGVAKTQTYISPEVAAEVKKMMRYNVEENYGDNKFKGLSMCGKTGTAEVSDGVKPHSWFMGFSDNENCPVAIVVIVENGGWGSSEALPIASATMEAIYKSLV
jgi:peptidoglycan glycosyltransferase